MPATSRAFQSGRGLAGSRADRAGVEVASIRPVDLSRGRGAAGGTTRLDASRVEVPLISLADLIYWAFRAKSYQVVIPVWTRESLWTISAKLPDGATQDQAPEMLATLLKDRFALAIHHEPREQQAYSLTLASGGPVLSAASPDDFPAWDGSSSPGFDFSGPLRRTGRINGRIVPQPNCNRQYQFLPLSMAALADTLTLVLGRPVADETGLQGTYKVTLEVPAEAEAGMTMNVMRSNGDEPPLTGGTGTRGGGGGRGGGDPGADGGRPAPPKEAVTPGCSDPMRLMMEGSFVAPDAALIRALPELGLKLQLGRANIDTIVVDHLEKMPTEN